jgi:Protein of unknown function (DUF2905)
MDKGIGPWLVGIGVALALVGGLAWAGWLSWLGRLPGDIRITSGTTKIFVPITTMVIVSVAATIVLSLIRRR